MKVDQYTLRQIREMERKLYSTAISLETAAEKIERSIQGVNTWRYTKELKESAESYRKAARSLSRIQ